MGNSGDDLNGFCNNLLNMYSTRTNIPGIGPANGTGVLMIALGVLYLFNSALIVYFIKIQQRNAWLKSIVQEEALIDGENEKPPPSYFYNNSATYSVIFPLFVKVLWLNTFVDLYVFFVALNFTFEINDADRISDAIAFSFMWALQHLVTEGVAILLMQKGVGFNAAAKTVRITILWAIFTFFAYMLVYTQSMGVSFAILMIWEMILFSFYLCLWIFPPRRLYRRPAAIHYAQFWCLFRVVNIISTVLNFIPVTNGFSNCFYVFCCLFPFAILQPWILYYTLLQDSKWWQGFNINQGRRTRSAEEIRSPLQGVDLNLRTAQSLARSMDSISSGSRKRSQSTEVGGATFRNGGVRLLNFAYISMDSTKLIGSGSFSKVYIGSYRQKKCAIKLIFTPDLTEDVIQRIGAEAQILSSINHPNIVDIIGVAVLPPSVCILLELCEFGSLADVLKGSGFPSLGNTFRLRFPSQINKKKASKGRNANRDSSTARNAMQLSWVDRLYLAVGCCRGLAALHAYSADLCHRDIKSFNFLVDHQMNAKIADLELGTPAGHNNDDVDETDSVSIVDVGRANKGVDRTLSRCLKRVFFGSSKPKQQNSPEEEEDDDDEAVEIHVQDELVEDTEKKQKKKKKSKKLQAEDFLANWSAPEVIQGKLHSQASDIYSFSLVLWEILTSIVPFSHIKKQDDIRLQVLGDHRPELPRLQLVPAFSKIRKSSFNRRSGVSSTMEDDQFRSTVGSQVGLDKDLDDQELEELAEAQWVDEEADADDESFIDRMAKKSLAHFVALIQRSWQRESNLRPSASEVLNELEALWHGCCHNLVFDTDADLTETNADSSSSENSLLSSSPSDGLSQSHSRFSGTILNSVTSILSFQPASSHASGEANFSFVLAHPYHPLSRRFVRSVNECMRNHPDERFRFLQDSGEAWVVLSLEAPHILLHATTQWCGMFDLTAAMVLEGWLGRPFKDIAPLSSDDTERAQGAGILDNFLQLCNTTMNDAKGRAAMHCTLKFMKRGRPNIYSLHAFPIYRRTMPTQRGSTSKSIRIPAGDLAERRNLTKDLLQEGQPASSSLPEESTVSGQLPNGSGLSRSCPAPHNLMQQSSDIEKSIGSVSVEGDNLTDSTSGSTGSGIRLLLASAAGKDGSLSGSGSGSGSRDSIRESGSPGKASRLGSSGILKKPASSSSWLFRPSTVDEDSKSSSSSRASVLGTGRFSTSASRSSVTGLSRRKKPVLLAVLFSKLKSLSAQAPGSKGAVQDDQKGPDDSNSSVANSSKQSVQLVAEALLGDLGDLTQKSGGGVSHVTSTVDRRQFNDLEQGSDPLSDALGKGDASPRHNLQPDDECSDQVMSGYTVNEFEVGFEMDKL